MRTKREKTALACQMAAQASYDDAWMTGLELQSFGRVGAAAFRYVLDHGTAAARRAAAFWLSDDAECAPPEVFLAMAADADSEIRFYAAYGLGYIQHPETVKALQKMMRHDHSPEVRQTAAQSLYPAARLNNCVETIIDDFAFALARDKSPIVREEAATSLANFLKTPVLHKAIELLEKTLKDEDESVRVQARISLSVLRNEVWDDIRAASSG
jgi:HEAT repeat protein